MSVIKPYTFQADLTGLDNLIPMVESQLQIVVDKFAQLIKARAQYYVPVDQGVAKNSIYVDSVTVGGGEKGAAISNAIAQKDNDSRYGHEGRMPEFAPDDEREGQLPPLLAIVCCAVIYGNELEFAGTNVRAENPGAQRPFLRPALDDYGPEFISACGQVLTNLGRAK